SELKLNFYGHDWSAVPTAGSLRIRTVTDHGLLLQQMITKRSTTDEPSGKSPLGPTENEKKFISTAWAVKSAQQKRHAA
ncbi:hypothetical protein GT037_001747, partial [Alternaria burnsii]